MKYAILIDAGFLKRKLGSHSEPLEIDVLGGAIVMSGVADSIGQVLPRHFVIHASKKLSTGSMLLNTAPLFEKEWHVGAAALTKNIFHPHPLHDSRSPP